MTGTGRKPFAVYAITKHGAAMIPALAENMPGADFYVSEKVLKHAPPGGIPMALPMGPLLQRTFTAYDCHVFIISVGAVVRMIAPLLRDKKVDPAVVCVDDAKRFAVCTLSGHVGRGNAYTDRVAAVLGAHSVVTTASDVQGTLTVDILGRDLGWTLEDADRNVTRACAAVVNQTRVCFVQETGEPDWWPLGKELPPGVEYSNRLDDLEPMDFEILLISSDRDLKALYPEHHANSVIYRPKSLVLGIGCDRNTPPELVERGVRKILADLNLAIESVRTVATIDLKGDEPAILDLCKRLGADLKMFRAEELDSVAMPTPSQTVAQHVGTRGVAEPAALLASQASSLIVTKQIYTEPSAGRSMTLAVARIPFEKRSGAKL